MAGTIQKFLALSAGKVKQVAATVVSGGAASAGAIAALDGTGRLDLSTMPLGVGPDIEQAVASEALTAGAFVNFFNSSGTINVRLADNSNGREAHGFVKSAFAQGATAIVYDGVPNEAVSGKTPGARQYLGTAGGVIEVPLDETLTANVGKYHQFLGVATSASAMDTAIQDYIQL